MNLNNGKLCSNIAVLSQKFPNHKTLDSPDTTEYVLENLYPNTLYHVWVAAKSRRGEGAATPELAVRTEQYGKLTIVRLPMPTLGNSIKKETVVITL